MIFRFQNFVAQAMLILACVIFFFLSPGCSARSPEELLSRHQVPPAGADLITVCVSYACRHIQTVVFYGRDLEMVAREMSPKPEDSPEQERERISRTIGLMERIIGPRAGTDKSTGRNRPGPPGTRQLDCIADSVNTTAYLLLLSRENLVFFHQVAAPARRGPLTLNLWHNTAVIRETDTGLLFAVDPWFNDNGYPAAIIPLDKWLAGYSPD
jgi:hypothetical protein